MSLSVLDPSNIYGQAVIFYKKTCGLDDAARTQAAAGDKDARLFLAYIHIETGEPVMATM